MIDLNRRPRMGLLLISPERFQTIGEGTARGSYKERKQKEAEWMAKEASAIAEVTFPGVIYTAEDVKRAIDAFVTAKVDYVLAIYLSWAEDFAWIRFLRDMPACPVLFCHRMRDKIELKDTHDDDEFAEYLCCGGLVGSLEASGSVKRFNRPMLEVYAGTWTEVLARAKTFGNAARARSLFRESTMGLLACMNEVMWSTYVDPYAIFRDVGPELRFLSVAELEDTVNTVSDADATAVMKRIASQYEVLPNVDEGKFLASVRASMGMERLAEKKDLDLLVLNDIDTVLFQHIGLRPGFWPTSPEVKTLIVPEGDIGGRLLRAEAADRRPCELYRALPHRPAQPRLRRGSRGPQRLHRSPGQVQNFVRRALCQNQVEIRRRSLCVVRVPGRRKDHAALLSADGQVPVCGRPDRGRAHRPLPGDLFPQPFPPRGRKLHRAVHQAAPAGRDPALRHRGRQRAG